MRPTKLRHREDGQMELQAELIIVGGGLAGFAAALTAGEAGLETVVLEKQSEIGGSSVMSGGCLAFAGTDIQKNAGIEDTGELLFKDLREVGRNENNEAVVRAYADEQLATYEWLKAHGAEFNPMVEAASGQSVPRAHTVDPADLVRTLAARAKATGKVTLMTSTRVLRLTRDKSNARVTGVVAEQGGKTLSFGGQRAVLLASGGFGANAALVHRFAPQYDEALFICGEGNEGDGLLMAWALGADFRDMIYIKGTYGKHPTDETNHHSCLAVYKGAIAVNQDGKRYVDESISYKLLGDACMQQPYATTFQILDRDILESGDNRIRILDFERRLEEGLFVEAESLRALAEKLGISPDSMVETVARYNRFVDQGADEEFGRRHLVHNQAPCAGSNERRFMRIRQLQLSLARIADFA